MDRFKALKELFYINKREYILKHLASTFEKMNEVFNTILSTDLSTSASLES